MRLTDETRQEIRDEILDFLSNNNYCSTYEISKVIGRSWELTYKELKKLYKRHKVDKIKLSYGVSWKCKDES